MTAWLICALLALAVAGMAWRVRAANQTVDRILADHQRLQQGRPARCSRTCVEVGCVALLRGDEPDGGGL